MAMCYRTFVMKASFWRDQGDAQTWGDWRIFVGAGLLAKAVDLFASMLDGLPPSRASLAPTGVLGWIQGLLSTTRFHVGASLLAKAMDLFASMSDGLPPSRASLAPTGVLGWIQGLLSTTRFHVGSGVGDEACRYWCCTCTIELTCTLACICSAPPPRRMPRTGQASR